MMIIELGGLQRYRGEIHWGDVAATWNPAAQDGAGACEGRYECGRVRREGELLVCIEHWRGLFGGLPGGRRFQQLEGEGGYLDALTHGQVQEATQTPRVLIREGKKVRKIRIPGQEDLHQLTPSASFAGARGPIWFPYPIRVPAGARFVVDYLCSQRDRGAHFGTVFYTVRMGEG